MATGAARKRLREDAIARGVRWGLRPLGSPAEGAPAEWRLNTLLGRLVEVSGGHASAALAAAFVLVREAQGRGEPVGWIANAGSGFYPPDAAAAGIDLNALAVIRLPDVAAAPRVADPLVRSGGFGLLVMDYVRGSANQHSRSRSRYDAVRLPIALQTRLAGLAKRHCAAIVCLTQSAGESESSLGPLISLRVRVSRDATRSSERSGDSDEVTCEIRALKDKRRGGGWRHRSVFRGPPGLC